MGTNLIVDSIASWKTDTLDRLTAVEGQGFEESGPVRRRNERTPGQRKVAKVFQLSHATKVFLMKHAGIVGITLGFRNDHQTLHVGRQSFDRERGMTVAQAAPMKTETDEVRRGRRLRRRIRHVSQNHSS